MTSHRLEVQRTIAADPPSIFRLLCDPQGHVAIDSSGMLMDATGGPVAAAGDSFVVHMDREALNDYPLGRYEVTVTIATFVPDREIAWTVFGRIRPQIGHVYGYVLEPLRTARSSPRTTTGRPSTRPGRKLRCSRSYQKGLCGPPWGSLPRR